MGSCSPSPRARGVSASAATLPALFLLLGGSILAGWAGQQLFRRYRVSDILFLLAVGFVAGPLLGLVDRAVLAPAIPFLGPLGLAIILFEGGLELRWDELRRHAGLAVGLTLVTWTATAGALAAAAHFALGLAWPLALLFAVAVAATGIVAVIPILAQVKAPAKARVVLTVETSLGDLLSAVAVTTLASIYVLGGTPWTGAGFFAAQVAVGAAIGTLAGVVWARALHRLEGTRHGYALTLAALLLAVAAAQVLGGSIYLAAVVFGVFLGNAPALMSLGRLSRLAPPTPLTRFQQGEVIFILRSLYFVFLGLSLTRQVFSPPFLVAAAILTGAMVLARVVSVALVHRVRTREDADNRLLIVGLMPRAMAAAVLATIPAAMGVPGTEGFLGYTFLVIVGADLFTTACLFTYEKRREAADAGAAGERAAAPQ